MPTYTLPVASSEFADGESAQGTEVNSQDAYLLSALNGGTLDSTNVDASAVWPWTGRHSWSISDANNDNLALTVGAVMAAAKYGLKISSSAAQINAALVYIALSNASSTVPCLEFADAGTGSTLKITKTGNGTVSEFIQSTAGATAAVYQATQAGTGACYAGTLRTLTGLNAPLAVNSLYTSQTVSNSTTETSFTQMSATLPADFLKAGTTLRGSFWGLLSTAAAGPATARIKVYYGGTSGTVLLDTGAFTPATSLANAIVKGDIILTCVTTGGSGTMQAQGIVTWNSNTVPVMRGMGTGGTGAGNSSTVTIDTSAAKDLVISFTWGSAVADCSFTVTNGHWEIIK